MSDAGPRAGAQCSGATRAAMHHGAKKSACKKTPPVKCATLNTSDNASMPPLVSEAGVSVMSQGTLVIDPRPSGDLKFAASAEERHHEISCRHSRQKQRQIPGTGAH